MLTPLIFVGEHKKKILPEFDKLPGKRVAILIWADPATLFDYPYARFELATYVGSKLADEVRARELATQVVDARDVEDFIQKNIDAQVDPLAVGRQFDADYVIFLEIITFQIRDANQPQFLKGVIEASVSVTEVRNAQDPMGRFELTPVRTTYADGNPVLLSPRNAALVRETLYRKFAEEVARKFYEHTVEML